MKACTKCHRRLPLIAFPSAGKRGREPDSAPCKNDERRLRAPLPPVERNPVQVRLNNTFNLWHGPVRRVLLRSHA